MVEQRARGGSVDVLSWRIRAGRPLHSKKRRPRPGRLCHHRKPLQLRRRRAPARGTDRTGTMGRRSPAVLDLIGADDDRAAAVVFYYVYFPRQCGMRVIRCEPDRRQYQKSHRAGYHCPETLHQTLTRRRQSPGLATSVSRPGWSELRIATSRRSSRCPSRVREGPLMALQRRFKRGKANGVSPQIQTSTYMAKSSSTSNAPDSQDNASLCRRILCSYW